MGKTGVSNTLFPGTLLVLFCSTAATPLGAATVPPPGAHASRPAATPVPYPAFPASSLYSRRSRRLVQSYLRLKLLETRLAGLERARAVIERKLRIDALVGETPSPNAR